MKVSDGHLEELTHDEGFICHGEVGAMAAELLAARRVVEAARKLVSRVPFSTYINATCEAAEDALTAYDKATK